MPDYSEYIIKENGKVEIFTNYRGDYTFLSDVFLGPILTKEFIKRQTKQECSKGDNALSAIVLDYDREELLLEAYPSEEEDGTGIFTNEILLKLLEIRYPKWIVKYAKKGIADRLEYISKSNKEDKIYNYEKHAWDEPKGTLISIKKNSEIVESWIELNLYDIIPKGPDFIFNAGNHKNIPENRFPFGGLHLDLNDKTLYFWYFNPMPLAEKWAKQFWEDYKVSFQFNEFRKQFELIDPQIFHQTIDAAKEKAIGILRDDIVYSYEQYSKISSLDNRYVEELALFDTKQRLTLFDKAIKTLYESN